MKEKPKAKVEMPNKRRRKLKKTLKHVKQYKKNYVFNLYIIFTI